MVRPVPDADAVFGSALTALMARRGLICLPRHRVALSTVSEWSARTSSFVPEGTRSAGSSNPPLKTVYYYRTSQRDRNSSASSGEDISRWSEGKVHQIPYSGCDFAPQDIGGEWIMRQKCPGIEGVQAVPSGLDCGDLSPLCPVGDLSPRSSATDRRSAMRWGREERIRSASLRRESGDKSPQSKARGTVKRDHWRRPGLAAAGHEDTRRRVAHFGHALIGLVSFFAGLTWAFARGTRSSPGYHIGGLQPQRSEAPPEAKAYGSGLMC